MKNEQWFITTKRADFNALARELHISPILARLIRNRDIEDLSSMRIYLNGSLADLPDPMLLKDVLKGAGIIRDKIQAGKKIRIISDYDVDGVSSNYILYLGLKRCGADVDYRIPDRIEDGYGINEHLIEQAAEDGIDTIITCDNGIAAASQVAFGNEKGITFVITDHHDVPFEEIDGKKKEILPPAAAVINPKQADCPYPYKNICGAVVAWKFIQVLYSLYGYPMEETEAFLEMAALATVCDVMPLRDENRIIVKEGLIRMQRTNNLGLRALIDGNQIDANNLKGWHFGFIIGPCINASGRLSTAKMALDLLLCQDPAECTKMAQELIALNNERKEMTKKGVEDALNWLEETGHADDKVLVIYLPECHESIAGIIAGRIRETYNKPAFVLTRTLNGVKGSGRSIEAYHMYEEMTKVKECFDKYGGHPKAAGLSMQEDRIEELRTKLNDNTTLTEKDFIEKVQIDIALPIEYLSEPLIKEIERLEPFGTENPKPLFAQKDMYITGIRELGSSGRVLKLFLKNKQGHSINAIWFGDIQEFYQDVEAEAGTLELVRMKTGQPHRVRIHCTYYPEINEWGGRRTIQIVIKNYKVTFAKRS